MCHVIHHDAGIHPRLPVLIRLTNQRRGSQTRGDPGGTRTSTNDCCHEQLSVRLHILSISAPIHDNNITVHSIKLL